MTDYSALIDNANTGPSVPNASTSPYPARISPSRLSPEIKNRQDINITIPSIDLTSSPSGDSTGLTLPMDKDPRVVGGAFSALFLFWLLINHLRFDGANWHLFQFYIQALALTVTFFIVEAVFVWSWFPTQSTMIRNPETNTYALVPIKYRWVNIIFLISAGLLLLFCASMTFGYFVLILGYWDKFANRGPWLIFSLLITGLFMAGWDYLCWLKAVQTYRTWQSYDVFMRTVSALRTPMIEDNDDVFS